eukprot:4747659-Pyramimonas_sp.AAC.1
MHLAVELIAEAGAVLCATPPAPSDPFDARAGGRAPCAAEHLEAGALLCEAQTRHPPRAPPTRMAPRTPAPPI